MEALALSCGAFEHPKGSGDGGGKAYTHEEQTHTHESTPNPNLPQAGNQNNNTSGGAERHMFAYSLNELLHYLAFAVPKL